MQQKKTIASKAHKTLERIEGDLFSLTRLVEKLEHEISLRKKLYDIVAKYVDTVNIVDAERIFQINKKIKEIEDNDYEL